MGNSDGREAWERWFNAGGRYVDANVRPVWEAGWDARDSELAALQATVARLTEALERAIRLAKECPVLVTNQRGGESFPSAYVRCEIEQRQQIADLETVLAATAADSEAWLAQQKREAVRAFVGQIKLVRAGPHGRSEPWCDECEKAALAALESQQEAAG